VIGIVLTTLFAMRAGRGEESAPWKTGVDFRRALADSVGVNWGELTLRDALHSLAHSQNVCIFLDRRVDGEQPVQFVAKGEPLESLLARFARERRLGTSVVGSVIYVGPRDTAQSLATLAALKRQEAGELPPKGKAAWLKSAPLRWPALAQPQAIVQQVVAAGGASLANPELLTHDLWNAGSFPALPAADRLTLLLAGFDLTFALENGGAEVRLLPAPNSLTYRASYPARGDAAKAITEIRRLFPEVEVQRQGLQLQVAGRYEDHERIERLLRGETVRTTKAVVGEKRYTVNVERQQAGAVLKRIASDTNRELKFAPDLLPKLKEPVTFKVENVPLEELLKTTLGGLGLSWKLDDDTLEIIRPD
jgi:hypothetical protein